MLPILSVLPFLWEVWTMKNVTTPSRWSAIYCAPTNTRFPWTKLFLFPRIGMCMLVYIWQTTLSSITAIQNTVDPPSGNVWYDGWELSQNIIPSATSACKAVGKTIQKMNRKLTSFIARIPNLSITDLTWLHD